MTPASPIPPDASRRSWIDTENSVLLHRGYPVDQLARQCDFLEVAYLMLNGDAPDEASYQTFRETITRHTLVHEQIARMCSGFRRDSHPMALMCALVGRWRRSIMMYWMWKSAAPGAGRHPAAVENAHYRRHELQVHH